MTPRSGSGRSDPAALRKAVVAAFEGQVPPTTLADLAAMLGRRADRRLVEAVEACRRDTGRVYFVTKSVRGQPIRVEPDAPIYDPEALETPPVLGHVLEFVLRQARTARTAGLSSAEIAGRLRGQRGRWIKQALDTARQRGGLPPGFGGIWRHGAFVVFALRDMVGAGASGEEPEVINADSLDGSAVGAAVSAASAFATAFADAFDRLLLANEGINFIKLADLRAALPDYSREAFDDGLRTLRLEDRYALAAAEGTHARLTEDERAAGVYEAGSLYTYCQRISDG